MNNLKDVEKFFIENGFGAKFDNGDETMEGVRLRLDLELADDPRFDIKQICYIMFELVAHTDLVDLGRNGDRDNGDDVMLKSIDGANKLGVDWDGTYTITHAHVFPERKPKKETTEYTVYLIVQYPF